MAEVFSGIEPRDAKAAEKMAAQILKRSSGTIYATELALSVLVRVVQNQMGSQQARTWAQEKLVALIAEHFDQFESNMYGAKDYF